MSTLSFPTTGRAPVVRHAASVAVLAAAASLSIARTVDPLATMLGPICASAATPGNAERPLGTVAPISSEALPNVPGKRLTTVRVTYAPGGYTPPHRHPGSVMAYVTAGTIRSQLGGGPIETFKTGESFFEPPGATHLVSENASATEPAELVAIFVADEGATLTTYLE